MMSEWVFWLVMLAFCAFLWWAAFYATKDMRIKKNRMRQEQAQRKLQAAMQKESKAAHEGDR
jgi:hypothetical protein